MQCKNHVPEHSQSIHTNALLQYPCLLLLHLNDLYWMRRRCAVEGGKATELSDDQQTTNMAFLGTASSSSLMIISGIIINGGCRHLHMSCPIPYTPTMTVSVSKSTKVIEQQQQQLQPNATAFRSAAHSTNKQPSASHPPIHSSRKIWISALLKPRRHPLLLSQAIQSWATNQVFVQCSGEESHINK